MKTAVSIPDKLFKEAVREAKRLGISRSKLYQTALEDLLRRREEAVTAAINASLAACPQDEEEIAWLNAAARTVMEHSEWVERPVDKRKVVSNRNRRKKR